MMGAEEERLILERRADVLLALGLAKTLSAAHDLARRILDAEEEAGIYVGT